MDGRLTWTDCDEAGDYVVHNVLSPRDLLSRPDNMDETVLHTQMGRIPEWTFTFHVLYFDSVGLRGEKSRVRTSRPPCSVLEQDT